MTFDHWVEASGRLDSVLATVMILTQDPELPGYSDIGRDTALPTTPPSTAGPGNVHLANGSEYRTGLEDEKGYAWLVLQVRSRTTNPKSMPFFLEGDIISGIVDLDAAKTDSVKAVFVEIQAGTTAVGQEEDKFLVLKETLWTSSEGTKASPKLKGKYSWPFEFALPKEVNVVPPHGRSGLFPLPPSFSERASPAYLDYRIVVTIKRGMLRVNQKLVTTIMYQPFTVPDSSPTPLRLLAYSEGNFLPSPKQDSEGWKVLRKVSLSGNLFEHKNVEVHCQLSIAKPLQYALGSPIPLHVVLESEDTQALDIVGNPAAIKVELIRAMTTGAEATAENPERRTDNFFTVPLSGAYFWRVDEPGDGPNRKTLQGEIDVEMKLKPTFVFPGLSVEYMINFTGFEATGWLAKSHAGQSQKGQALLSEPVRVTSKQLVGVRMLSNAPPGYKKPQIDYNKSLGYLENGNQRFLHHGR